MKIDKAKAIVASALPHKRMEHTLRVAEVAVELAIKFGADPYQAELAAIFHDYAKYRSDIELKRWIKTSSLPKDLLHFHSELWHGPVASILIEMEFGITDRFIQDAIRYHTTGKANMGLLTLIIFIADYIEPGRSFPGLDEVRNAAKHDIIHAAFMVSKNTIIYLMNKGATIYPDSFHAYNDLVLKVTNNESI